MWMGCLHQERLCRRSAVYATGRLRADAVSNALFERGLAELAGDRAHPAEDRPGDQKVTDSSVLPRPNCGEDVIMNVRGGCWFIGPLSGTGRTPRPMAGQQSRAGFTVLEIGAGFNTPSVIRWPMGVSCISSPRAHLIRVNLQYPQVPREIAGKSISLPKACHGRGYGNPERDGAGKSGALTWRSTRRGLFRQSSLFPIRPFRATHGPSTQPAGH